MGDLQAMCSILVDLDLCLCGQGWYDVGTAFHWHAYDM